MEKITVIGAGNVGATCANVIAHKDRSKLYLLVFMANTLALWPLFITPSMMLFIAIGPPSFGGHGDLLQMNNMLNLSFITNISFLQINLFEELFPAFCVH